MSKRLTENITSSYVEASNRMASKRARRKIIAYVESYDDVFFWRTVLSAFENEQRFFEVMLPCRVNRLERGKKAAIMGMFAGRVGRDMIACVDADYDYLLQGRTPASRLILSNPYIFHTYAYSIENLQCWPASLHDVCVAVTLNDHALFDFEEYLRQYSKAVFPLFVWSVWYYRSDSYTDFSITDFLKIIEPGNFTIQKAEGIIKNVRRKVFQRVRQLQEKNPDAKDSYLRVKEDLLRLGVTPETTYLYIRGHHVFDKVVLPMLKKICDQLVREREREISYTSIHSTQRRNELSCYTSSVADISNMLKKNLGYMASDTFLRIRKDVEAFLKEDAGKTSVTGYAEADVADAGQNLALHVMPNVHNQGVTRL